MLRIGTRDRPRRLNDMSRAELEAFIRRAPGARSRALMVGLSHAVTALTPRRFTGEPVSWVGLRPMPATGRRAFP